MIMPGGQNIQTENKNQINWSKVKKCFLLTQEMNKNNAGKTVKFKYNINIHKVQ